MTGKLLLITILILVILFMTWVKDGEKMDPPLKKRVVIDLSTILVFWIFFLSCSWLAPDMYVNEMTFLLNAAVGFFVFRTAQLLGQLNDTMKEFYAFLENRRKM
ncbi:holin [Lactococcus garvieae]